MRLPLNAIGRSLSSQHPLLNNIAYYSPRRVVISRLSIPETTAHQPPASIGIMAQQSRKASSDSRPPPPEPRPSSSVVLISPQNQVLLLHRVQTSTSFASAHVFPGGNLDAFHDGDIPSVDSPERHQDGPAYRMGAIRETFEETGILLAKKDGELIDLTVEERNAARKTIHGNQVKFQDWLQTLGATPDLGTNTREIATKDEC